eukprot:TRINITY_DN3797_c0_g1_i1.p1 TRINITY_DN3797_c0_g1~~TRINITY_DN3797_c0_g1_i1.p1  ORF type:complete len:449 (-),score=114.31 TRINITY_DN3797_c0_g1_i1:569-1888(-)
MALDQFASTVITLTTQKSYSELSDFLNRQSAILSGNIGQLESLYESLDESVHTMGCLAIVSARLKGDNIENWDQMLQRIDSLFTEISDEQQRFSNGIIVEICQQLSSQLIKNNLSIRGIPVVQRAVAKLQTKPEMLTAAHADLTKLCLKAQCFSAVLPILDIDITKISREEEHFDPCSLLLYYYYGGCIYLAVKQFEKALYFFEVTVTCPTAAVSHVMLEAYKKYLLLNLLVHGDKPKDFVTLPKFTSPIVGKFVKPLCYAYTEIVNAYHLNNVDELRNVIAKYRDIYDNDSNLGLVNQVHKTQVRSNIKRLTKPFVTLSLADVASRVGLQNPAAAEKEIVEMIREGCIHATISQQDGMVSFDANPESYSNPDVLRLVEGIATRAIQLDKKVEKLTEEIMVSKQYLKRMVNGKEQDDEERLSSNSAVSSGGSRLPAYTM